MQRIQNAAARGAIWSVALLVGWFAAGSLPVRAANTELAGRPWVELRTPSFRAFACGKTQELMSVVARLEQFRLAYSSLAGAQSVASVPILMYAFPDDRAFTPFKPLYEGKPKNVSGYFTRAMEANFIALDLGISDAATLEMIFHEYTHLLLRRNARYWPLWLEEGMAELYSTFATSGNEVLIGKPPLMWLRVLAKEPIIPLRRLFEIKHDSPEYNEKDRQGIYYAQSWLLAHYLTMGDNPAHRARFGQYTRLLRGGMEVVPAFTNAFATSLPVMERELKGYLARAKFEPTRLKLPPQNAARQTAYWRSVPPAETAFWLGRLLLQLQRTNDARQNFELAAKLQPRAPFGVAGLGLLAADAGQTQSSIQLLDQAVKLGSQDYQVYYELGRQRLEQVKVLGVLRPLTEPEAALIRAPLQRAVALMPACAPAHNRLGYLEMVQGENPDAAERHLQAAATLEPDNCNYVLMYGRFLVRLGKADKARETLFEMSQFGAHPKCQAQAKELLSLLPPSAATPKTRARPK